MRSSIKVARNLCQNLKMKRLVWRENNGDEDGDTVLHFAAAKGNYNLLYNSLLMGCKVDDQNNMGWTPLMQAAKNGNSTCAKLLVDFGADVTLRNRFAFSGDLDTVKVILKSYFAKGIQVSGIEKNISPVFFAVVKNHIDVLRYLEKYKFNLNKTIKIGGVSPVNAAAILKRKEIKSFYKRRGIMAVNVPSPGMNQQEKFSTPAYKTYSILPNPNPPVFSFSPCATPFNSPSCYSPSHFYSPSTSFYSPAPNIPTPLLEVKKRKSSNFSLSSTHGLTPNLSPITAHEKTCSSISSISSSNASNMSNSLMNSRIKLIFSSSSNDSFKFVPTNRNTKCRSCSCSQTVPELPEDVFVLPTENNKKEFVEMLRKNSLDSCISLFEKHEIDMDLFLTLSQSDLEDIGINWDKRDDVLELIYQCNKMKM